jgi:hypothetical protein
VAPLGQVLAGPHFEGECLLTADLDLGEMVRGKYYSAPERQRSFITTRE